MDEASIFTTGNVIVDSYIDNNSSPVFTDASFIDLYGNGRYNMYIHHYEEGKYKYKRDTLFLKRDSGEEWKIWFRRDSSFNLGHFKFQSEEALHSLRVLDNSNSKKYPFSISNNKWRKKQQGVLNSESHAGLIIDQLTFLKKYIIWCNKVKKRIKLRNLPGPIQIARNGVAVRNPKTASKWCRLFEGEECLESFEVAKMAFKTNLEFKRFGNPVTTYLDIIDQMISNLEEIK